MKVGILSGVKPLGTADQPQKEPENMGGRLVGSLAIVLASVTGSGYAIADSPTLTQLLDKKDQAVEIYSSSPEPLILQSGTYANLKRISSDSFMDPPKPLGLFDKPNSHHKENALRHLARVLDAGVFDMDTTLKEIKFVDPDALLLSRKDVRGVYYEMSKAIELRATNESAAVLLHEIGHHLAPHRQELRSQLQTPSVSVGYNSLDDNDKEILAGVVGRPGTSDFSARVADAGLAFVGVDLRGVVGEGASLKARSTALHQEWVAEAYAVYANYKVGGLEEVKSQLDLWQSIPVDPDKEAKHSHRDRIALANLVETLVRYEPMELPSIKEKVIPNIIRESLQRSVVDQHMFDRSAQLNLYVKTGENKYELATNHQNYRIAKDYFAREIRQGEEFFDADQNNSISIYDPKSKDILIINKEGEEYFNLSKSLNDNPALSSGLKGDLLQGKLNTSKGLNNGVIDKEKIEIIRKEHAVQRDLASQGFEINMEGRLMRDIHGANEPALPVTIEDERTSQMTIKPATKSRGMSM